MLDKTSLMNDLLDWYEDLLTKKQKEIMHLYYHENLSLREIALELSISHNAVYDAIKKVEQRLSQLEESLGCVATQKRIDHLLIRLRALNQPEVLDILLEYENNDHGGKKYE